MKKILVADDEPLARDSIKALLQKEDDNLEVHEAQNGEQALEIAWLEKPDLVFLDVQMPGVSGVEVAQELPAGTLVIFTTAYDEYAVKAFELNALDYLLKPFKNIRFFEAYEKAKEKFTALNLQSAAAESDSDAQQPFKTRLVIKEPKRVRVVEVEQIKYITGAGNYVELHLFNGNTLLYRETMAKLESHLDTSEFRRIHRSTIIRLSTITELQPNYQGDYTVLLDNGEQLILSRRYKENVSDLLG